MNKNVQNLAAWSGIAVFVVFFAGLWPVAQFFPPHLPTATADEIAAIYRDNTMGIRAGMILIMICGGLLCPFVAVISHHMRSIQGRNSRLLSYTQLATGTAGTLLFVIPSLIWSVAAYRPDRAPELTLVLNDLGWFFFVMPFTFAVFQNLAIGIAIVSDKAADPVFPRWIGFFNWWVAILFLPGGLLTFFKTGPFAWNGVLAFYVPATVFGAWFIVMFWACKRATAREA